VPLAPFLLDYRVVPDTVVRAGRRVHASSGIDENRISDYSLSPIDD
jgi:hypothetical protein